MTCIARRAPLGFALTLGVLACVSSGEPVREPVPLRTEPTSCVGVMRADTTVYDVRQIDEKPVFRRALKLTYPPEALHHRIQGRVVVRAVVNAGGDVDQSSVMIARHADPLLDAEARRIVASATLWPACRNGQAVRARIAVPFDFAVGGPAIAVWEAVVIGVVGGIGGAVLLDHTR
jgi:TonB family protein